jgi:NAD(P)-dependent dehydrogenase (short-subunit alcohol dehydrogenase family)
VESLFDSVTVKGPIDVVINASGAFRYGPFTEIGDADVDALVRANFLGHAFVLRAALRRMLPRGQGQVLVVAAEAAVRPSANMAMYGATKAATVHLVDAAAREIAGSGVVVNAVLPGTIDTAPNREAMPHANHAEWVPPEEIAKLAVGLAASEEPPNGRLYQFPLEPPGR